MWLSSEVRPAMQVGATKQFQLMIASRKRESLDQLDALVRPFVGVETIRQHICNGHADPLFGATTLPDLLLFWLGDGWEIELAELIERPASQRPPMLVIGSGESPQSLRMAMKAGAMDYFKAPFDDGEVLGAIRAVIDQKRARARQHSGALTAVINAKGGSGSSFIACNTAHILGEVSGQKVALVGLDIQFGGLCSYLDIEPEYGLMEALANVEGMDQTALRGFMTKHPFGLHVLDTRPNELLMPQEVDSERLSVLFDVMLRSFDQVVVDLPRQIDELTSVALERADKIIVVLQQSVAHLRDAQRLLKILQSEMHIPAERIVLVLNRFERKSDLTESSIAHTLGLPVAHTIPNAFDQVNECVNGGQLIYLAFKRAPVTRALLAIGEELVGDTTRSDKPILGKILSRLRGE